MLKVLVPRFVPSILADVMSKKEYVLLASAMSKALNEVQNPEQLEGAMGMVNHIIRALQADNERFREEYFRTAVMTKLYLLNRKVD